MTCRAGLPIALEPSWQDAHRPNAVAWLNLARLDDGPAVGSPGLNSPIWGIEGAAPGCIPEGDDLGALFGKTGAILAKFDVPGTVAGAGAVAGGINSEVDTGLLLKRTFAAELGAVGVAMGAGLACGEAVAVACGWVAAAVDGPD